MVEPIKIVELFEKDNPLTLVMRGNILKEYLRLCPDKSCKKELLNDNYIIRSQCTILRSYGKV